MNKIERVEYQVKLWKATEKKAGQDGDMESAKSCHFVVNGLELALGIIKEPSNTKTHVAKEPCEFEFIHHVRKNQGDSFCKNCGESLSQ